MGCIPWQQINGGKSWRVDGYIEIRGEGVVRTNGEPITMRTMVDDYGAAVDAAAERFGVARATIFAMIASEAVRFPGTRHFDPTSRRWEQRLGEASVGLMQTLVSTANHTNNRLDIYEGTVDEADLRIAQRSIFLGAGYLSLLSEKWGDDPILLSAAYNAGGVYDSNKNEWKIRTFGERRLDHFAEWYNDFVFVDLER